MGYRFKLNRNNESRAHLNSEWGGVQVASNSDQTIDWYRETGQSLGKRHFFETRTIERRTFCPHKQKQNKPKKNSFEFKMYSNDRYRGNISSNGNNRSHEPRFDNDRREYGRRSFDGGRNSAPGRRYDGPRTSGNDFDKGRGSPAPYKDKMSNLGGSLKPVEFDLSTLPKFEKNFYYARSLDSF